MTFKEIQELCRRLNASPWQQRVLHEELTNSCNPWYTGTPTEEGWYLIQLVDHKNGGIPYDVVRWTGKWGIYFPIPNEEVIAWQKIEPYKQD